MTPTNAEPLRRNPTSSHRAIVVGLLFAGIGTAGSLWLSLGMGLKACPLCFYQRSFVMAAFCLLAVGMWLDGSRPRLICQLSLPLIWAGLGVAAYHEYLVVAGVLECPTALFGFGSAPAQSLGIFVLLAASCTVGAVTRGTELFKSGSGTCATLVLLGLVMASACIASSPPLPPAPLTPYDPVKQPFEMCRPPFRAK